MQRVMGLALAAGMVALLGGCGSAAPHDVRAQDQRPSVDSVPGMGRSAQAALRDDTIAYWEAWKRASLTESCMDDAGFAWSPEVGYPAEAIQQIARTLNVSPDPHGVAVSAEAQNERLYGLLEPDEQDAYSRALYGESAADMVRFRATGATPGEDADSFASGGCLGAAWDAVPGVWDLNRKLGPEVLEIELQIKHSQFAEVRDQYRRCAIELGLEGVDGPEDLDQRLIDATALDGNVTQAEQDALVALTGTVSSRCEPIWSSGSSAAYARALSVVRGKYPDMFDAHIERYEAAMTDIVRDEDFRAFLSHAAAERAE